MDNIRVDSAQLHHLLYKNELCDVGVYLVCLVGVYILIVAILRKFFRRHRDRTYIYSKSARIAAVVVTGTIILGVLVAVGAAVYKLVTTDHLKAFIAQ